MNFGRWENEWSVILCMRWKRISSLFHTKQPHHQYSIYIIFACKYQRSARITRVFGLAYSGVCVQSIDSPRAFQVGYSGTLSPTNRIPGYIHLASRVRIPLCSSAARVLAYTGRTLGYTRVSNLVRVVCIPLVVMLWYVFGLPQSLHNKSV